MTDKNFVKKYLEDFSALVKPNEEIVENIHQVWLFTIADLVIGKREYLP